MAEEKCLFCDPQSVTSGIMHYAGVPLSIIGMILLLVLTVLWENSNPWKIVSFAIYGASSILLFAASGTFHTFFISQKVHRVLRKIDHSLVYFLIFGSYTPLCLVVLNGWIGWTIFGVVLGLTIIGIIIKCVWIEAPRLFSTISYVSLGWTIIIALIPLVHVLSAAGLFWLVAGGVIYTLGALVYNFRFPHINRKYFGDHELFHIFVLLGWLCHYYLMFAFVLPLPMGT